MQWNQDTILIAINLVLGIGGGIASFMIARLMGTIRRLEDKDIELNNRVTLHREDVLKNYVTSNDLDGVKDDIIDRIDRFEKTMLSVAGRRSTDRELR